jgi:hypothetical protein
MAIRGSMIWDFYGYQSIDPVDFSSQFGKFFPSLNSSSPADGEVTSYTQE